MTPNPQDSAVALEVERAAFEAWAKKRGNRLDKFGSALGIWAYEDDETQAAFVAWQARASQSHGTSGGWRPISTAPVGKQMFVARAFDVPVVLGRLYTTDPYCVWQEEKGKFARWPHGAMQPTHWHALPAAPTQGENHVG